MRSPDVDDDFTFVFERSGAERRKGWLMLVGGIVMACVSAGGFVLSIITRADQMRMHFMTTMPAIVAVGMFMGWWALCRGPRRVLVNDSGMTIEQGDASTRYAWTDLGWATMAATAMSNQKTLVVFDKEGRKLTSLSQSFEDFDSLTEIVKARVADQPPEVGSDIQIRRSRRSAVYTASFATIMIAASAFVAWNTHREQRDAKLLQKNAVEGVATIDELRIAPNGFTTRVVYTITNEAGKTASRNAEIEPDYHAELERTKAKTLPVLYVPDEPTISRVKDHEVIDDDFMKTPKGGYGLAGAGTLLCLFLFAVALMQWNGWDFDIDSKTKKFSIKRFGEGT